MGKRRFIGSVGPLAGYVGEFREDLARLGYGASVAERQGRLLREVSRWLVERGQVVDEFVPCQFIGDRDAAGLARSLSVRSLTPMINFLVARGLMKESVVEVDEGDLAAVVGGRFARFLLVERGLCAGTVEGYVHAVDPFVRSRHRQGSLDLAGITAQDVFAFLTAVCPGKSRGAASLTASAMRSLLGWLFVTGVIDRALAEVVPRVGSWRLAGLVEPVAACDVTRMLGSCDRTTTAGRRDYAMLLVLSRLGLRGGEVARLGLDDIDWRSGELIVRGKGPKDARMPVPADVGSAIADYLRHARPSTAQGRTVFVRVLAPHRELTTGGVGQAVFAAGQRAGVGKVRSHRLRHTAATAMLAAGGSLFEIGEVLRHQRPGTTAIYAKVDHARLRQIVRPWPASAS